MLTFRFTGITGEMTEEEMLTAGMEGKQVRLEFSEEWAGLRKAVVFAAGCHSCTIVDAEEVETIPAQILSESLRRLYVGAYGLTEEGMVVIPAMYATGPFIHIGAAGGSGDSGYVPEDPFWLEMEKAVNQTLRFTPQALRDEEKRQARQNIGAVAANPQAAQLLVTILQNGVYTTDQYENVLRLTAMLQSKGFFSVSLEGAHLTADNPKSLILEGDSYRTGLIPETGYLLESVTVTMGGEDITASVYADGIVHIPAVTGDVVIQGITQEENRLRIDQINKGSVSFLAGSGLQVNATSAHRAMVLPIGQYLEEGKSYRFGLRTGSSVYAYGVQVMTASGPDLSFPYVADTNTFYNTVTARSVDTGWLQTDYNYTATEPNQIFAVNFKRIDGNTLGLENYEFLQTDFMMEVVT